MLKTAKRMKHSVSMLEKSSTDDNGHLLNEREKDEWFKRMIDKTKEILNDDRFMKQNMEQIEQKYDDVLEEAYDHVNKKT